jgi:hypothetical protein
MEPAKIDIEVDHVLEEDACRLVLGQLEIFSM